MTPDQVLAFLLESNAIEGIFKEPTAAEVKAAQAFLGLRSVKVKDICTLQAVVAPGRPIRDTTGMNVRVGGYVAPTGGHQIIDSLALLIANMENLNPWSVHCKFEQLHPFMDGNGRVGRLLWAWQMRQAGQDPFALPFLHGFYYQTLWEARPADEIGRLAALENDLRVQVLAAAKQVTALKQERGAARDQAIRECDELIGDYVSPTGPEDGWTTASAALHRVFPSAFEPAAKESAR
jgi:hypothetical protein